MHEEPKNLTQVPLQFEELSMQDWEDLLKKRPKTVFISFGSIAQSAQMPVAMKEAIVQMARDTPEATFIWKYETEDGVGSGVENLVKTKWAPQHELLSELFLL